jgi:hypothetical protein
MEERSKDCGGVNAPAFYIALLPKSYSAFSI